MGLQWAATHCHEKTIILKMDDDIIVDVYEVFHRLGEFDENKLYGYKQMGLKPIRSPDSKWYAPDFQGKVYPNFLSGWTYITSIQVAKKIAENEFVYANILDR